MVALTCSDKRCDDLPEMLSREVRDFEVRFNAPFLGNVFLQGRIDALQNPRNAQFGFRCHGETCELVDSVLPHLRADLLEPEDDV